MIERLAGLARSPRGVALIAAWACAEAVLLPIVPDVALLSFVAAVPRATPRLVLGLLVGALVGSAILAGLVLAEPDRVRSLIAGLPGIGLPTISSVEADMTTRGAAVFAQVGPGVPLKVDTFAWIATGGSAFILAPAVVFNRLTRVGPGIVVAALIGHFAAEALRRHERIALAAYAVGWIAFYLVYWRVV